MRSLLDPGGRQRDETFGPLLARMVRIFAKPTNPGLVTVTVRRAPTGRSTPTKRVRRLTVPCACFFVNAARALPPGPVAEQSGNSA